MTKVIKAQKREWMKEIRNDLDLTVRDMAEILGISFQHYSDIENGRRNPSIELSLVLAEHFGVSVEKFLKDRTKFTRDSN
jgi:DNA-binding XRE family transcriptional regulator